MYFIEHGIAEVRLPDGNCVEKLKDGDHFGGQCDVEMCTLQFLCVSLNFCICKCKQLQRTLLLRLWNSTDLQCICVSFLPTEIALVMDQRRNACVVAFETCYIYSLSKADLDSVLTSHPDLKKHFEAEAKLRSAKSAKATRCALVYMYIVIKLHPLMYFLSMGYKPFSF